MKVVVTGGAGFIGSHVSEHYAKKGAEVTVLDSLSRATLLKKEGVYTYNWEYLKRYPNIKLVKQDIREFDKIKEHFKDADLVVHTAAQTAVTTSFDDPRTDYETNVNGTFNVLESIRVSKANPKLVFCSTNKVYGDNVNDVAISKGDTRYSFSDPDSGISESFSIDACQHTPYGCSKLAGDIYVQDYAHSYGMNSAVFRMSCIYGTRQFGVEDQGWLAWFVIAALTNKKITIYGDGLQVRDALFVNDLVAAMNSFYEKGKGKGRVYNIGGGYENTISLKELLRLISEITGLKPNVAYDQWRPSDQKVYVSDITRAKNELGWEPSISVKEGVDQLVGWVHTNISQFRAM